MNNWRGYTEQERQAVREAWKPWKLGDRTKRIRHEGDDEGDDQEVLFAKVMSEVERLADWREHAGERLAVRRHRDARDSLAVIGHGARVMREQIATFEALGFEELFKQLGLGDLNRALEETASAVARVSVNVAEGQPPAFARKNHVWRLARLWETSTGTKATCYHLPQGGYGGAFGVFAYRCIVPVDPACKYSFIHEALRLRNRESTPERTSPTG